MGRSVLVCCSRSWSSPSRLPRILQGADLQVTVFAWPGQLIARSKFVDTLAPAPIALDEYLEALREHLSVQHYDWVILADDPLLEALRKRHDEPWVAEILPIHGHAKWVGILASKADFTLLAQTEHLPIPDSRLCRTFADAQEAATELGLPIMLKRSTGFGGIGVAKVDSIADLPEIWSQLEGEVVVAQKFITGTIGSSMAVLARGKPLAWASGEKVRTWPGAFGPSTARRIAVHRDIGPTFERFGAATGYHGFAAFDWIIDAAGNFRVIELNTRPTSIVRLGEMAGTDFASAIRGMLSGDSMVYPPTAQPTDQRVVAYFPEDIMRAITRDGFTREAAASWIPRRGLYNDIPWQDPKLLSGYIQKSIVNLIQLWRLRKSAS